MNPIYLFRPINGTAIERDAYFIKKRTCLLLQTGSFFHFLSIKQQQLFPGTYLRKSVMDEQLLRKFALFVFNGFEHTRFTSV